MFAVCNVAFLSEESKDIQVSLVTHSEKCFVLFCYSLLRDKGRERRTMNDRGKALRVLSRGEMGGTKSRNMKRSTGAVEMRRKEAEQQQNFVGARESGMTLEK